MNLGIFAASIFEGFFEAVAGFLGLLFRATNSYGGAIIILTIIVMTVTAPLTLKSTRSMLQMQRHQPGSRSCRPSTRMTASASTPR